EDVHWADEMSLRLLAFVGRRVEAWPVLLIATARAEELADAAMARRTLEDLAVAAGATPVGLLPLSRSDTLLLLRALARAGENSPAMAHVEDQVWAMSEGNPFVAVEAIHALDRDRLADGLPDRPGALALPARVRDLVARRLERLGAGSQQVAAVAAV